MGQFSWKYADTRNRERLTLYGTAYVPCPDGTVIYEGCYQCYGIFGGHDIYDLVADWNRAYLSEKMIEKPARKEFDNNEQGERCYQSALKRYAARCRRLTDFVHRKPADYIEKTYGHDWKRNIGIEIACKNKDNAALPFPIKICKQKPDGYGNIPASKTDPCQGR